MSNDKQKPPTGGFAETIPEFYVDIICRIIPGFLIIALWFPQLLYKPAPTVSPATTTNLVVATSLALVTNPLPATNLAMTTNAPGPTNVLSHTTIDAVFRIPGVFLGAWTIGAILEIFPFTVVTLIAKIFAPQTNPQKTTKPQPQSPAPPPTNRFKCHLRRKLDWLKGHLARALAFLLGTEKTQSPIMDYDLYERRLILRSMAEVIFLRSVACIPILILLWPPALYKTALADLNWPDTFGRSCCLTTSVALLVCWGLKRWNHLHYPPAPGKAP